MMQYSVHYTLDPELVPGFCSFFEVRLTSREFIALTWLPETEKGRKFNFQSETLKCFQLSQMNTKFTKEAYKSFVVEGDTIFMGMGGGGSKI